jgi:hypothetical protein
MDVFNPIMASFKPYMLWIKLGIAGALVLSSFLGGCHYQKKADDEKIVALKVANGSLQDRYNLLTSALDDAKKVGEKAIADKAKREDEAQQALATSRKKWKDFYAQHPDAKVWSESKPPAAVIERVRNNPSTDN